MQARAHGHGQAAVLRYLVATYDADGDGRITPAEYARDAQVFGQLDRNQDGSLGPEDFQGPTRMDGLITRLFMMRHLLPAPDADAPLAAPTAQALAQGFARLDRNGDARLSRAEVEQALAQPAAQAPRSAAPDLPKGVHVYRSLLAQLDEDGSGDLSLAEWEQARIALPGGPAASAPRAPGTRPRPAPAVGDPAPDFVLPVLDAPIVAQLSDFRGAKPVALIFGSWT